MQTRKTPNTDTFYEVSAQGSFEERKYNHRKGSHQLMLLYSLWSIFTVDSAAAEDEQQLVVITELPRSNLPSELLTPPQSHIDTPQVPNSRPVFENSHKECMVQIDHKLNSLNTFIDHELSVLRDKMDSLSEGLQNVLTNKQHMGNKNMSILQENINNLQK